VGIRWSLSSATWAALTLLKFSIRDHIQEGRDTETLAFWVLKVLVVLHENAMRIRNGVYRRSLQPLPVEVLSDREQDLPYGRCDARHVNHSRTIYARSPVSA